MKLLKQQIVWDLSLAIQYYVRDRSSVSFFEDVLNYNMYPVGDVAWHQLSSHIQQEIDNETS